MDRYTWRTGVVEVLMIAVALVVAVPVVVLVNLALRPPSDTSSPLIPSLESNLDNFGKAWTTGNLGAAMVNSLVVTVVSVVFIIVFASLAAYPLARSTQRWSKVAYYGFVIGLLLPFQLALIPLYTLMRDTGLLGTLGSVIVFNIGIQMPFSIFMYTQFIRALPLEYEEAARIDGAGPIRTFTGVVFPLMRAVTGSVVILNVIFIWNDFFTPMLYLSGTRQQTLPVSLYTFTGQYAQQWNVLFAGIIIAILPVLIVYFLMQKTIIRGFAGGLKG